jgi:uridine kinase
MQKKKTGSAIGEEPWNYFKKFSMPPEKKPYVVGITGGSGSGKTLFIEKLEDQFQDGEISLLSQDHYYRPIEFQPKDELGIENFDTPDSIDFDHFLRDLQSLIKLQYIEKEEYTFNHRDVIPKSLLIKAAPILLVEGIFSFFSPDLLDLYDYKIFINASEQVKLERRIKRDSLERGYDKKDVVYRFEKHVTPTFKKYIEPLSRKADLVIDNNLSFEKELSLVTSHLKSKI